MRYIDSGNRDPAEALGTWLQKELTPDITELRWQSGFFSLDGLAPFVPTLQRLSAGDRPVYAVIGSNDGSTLEADMVDLVTLLGLPRCGARLGVVSYSGAYYHPKTYHLRRDDGSQAAYVGSANLTLAGVGSLNVEAGVLLDTQQGDNAAVLNAIAESVDNWFKEARAGVETVAEANDVTRLTGAGVLALAPPPRVPVAASGGEAAGPGRRIHPVSATRTRRRLL